MAFPYSTYPLPNMKRYTAQAGLRGVRRSEEVAAAVATRAGLSPEQAAALLVALGDYVVEQVMEGYFIDPLFGGLGFQGTCGGSHDSPNFTATFENIAVDIRLRMGKRARRLAEDLFRPEIQGHQGRVTPQVIRVTDLSDKQPDHYTPGDLIEVELAHRRGSIDPADPTQGVFFRASDGTEIRASNYGYNRGKLLVCVVPDALQGPQQLVVQRLIYGTLRSGIYSQALEPSST